ncbi:FecR domain-containing protein [Pseudomonas sp. S75]|uniref:FecR family protein n=1 Tax=unclassified Pseudomonas TaxID=196821 RepID=UPI001907F126|nr:MULTISPECIES: FecR domain-containing protein [unclassified Pseudomonas]MBJ9976775.1 FecR domain-containing protein [Pseudomonas sp. S30]MBK0153777.1 FecR domain-containing protein [Pseudomonas sp. S75]
MSSDNQPEQAIREQAAEWAVRDSNGSLDPAQRQALEHWCAADARHAQAFALACATWADMGCLGTSSAAPPRAAPAPARLPVRRPRRVRRALGAVAASLLLAVCVAQAPQWWLHWHADYLTGAAQVSRVTLADGSQVELNADSAIAVDFDIRQRRVRLLAGEAVFSAAPVTAQEPRPFVVEHAGARVQALGTRFVVGTLGDGGWVGMLEHRVAVALQHAPEQGRAEQVVEQGRSVRYDQAGGVRPWPERDVQRATDWERGVLVFERQPLAEVVARLNRYRAGKLVVMDGQLSRREVSGVFRLDQLAAAGQVLSDELHARRFELPGLTVIY